MIKHNHNFPLEEPATAPATGTNDFTPTQKNYLQGLAMGTDVARKIRGLPVITGAGAVECPANSRPEVPPIPIDSPDCWMAAAQQQQVSAGGTLCAEEIAKRDIHVSALWDAMMLRAAEGQFPKGTDVFLQKHFGMFYVAPAQNSYMCRLRFAGGALTAHQMHGLADIADHFAGGFTDVTTRANLQLREIAADNSMDVLLALRDLGILNSGAGADNIRNITASPLSGIDPKEAIETLPLARQLHHHILQHRELYGLPRKFNIAFDGGGSISSLDDTNDIGFHAVRLPAEYATSDCPEGVYFQLGLGGITGHLDFARDTGILVRPDQCVMVATAIVKVFIAHGNRTDRKKARLKYLLDAWGFTKFLEMVAAELTFPLARIPADQVVTYDNENRLAHIGWHSQRQPGMSYVGVVLPVGRLTAVQMRGISRIATQFGDGQLRLTVWQNLVIPNIRSTDQSAVEMELEALGLDWRASNVRAGLVACTGNAGCKYAAADTKAHAMQLASYVDERTELDQPLNIHLTGCHHSCAQHYIGDIGLQATGVEDGDEIVEGYHVFVGGGSGSRQHIARQLCSSVRFDDLPPLVLRLINAYQSRRLDADESFAAFTNRHTLDELLSWCYTHVSPAASIQCQ